MTSNTSSLRQMYAAPATSWTFVPPTDNGTSASTSSYPSSSNTASYQWSTRTSQNPFLDLSASLSADDSGYRLDVNTVVKGLVASLFYQYATSLVATPWEVGKILLQVQWVPRDADVSIPIHAVRSDDEEELSDSSNEDLYFTDPSNPSPSRRLPRQADEHGYVVRQSVLDEGTLPEYIIPVGSADGIWAMMKRLVSFRPEGWLALWKGSLTTCAIEIVTAGVQPFVLSVLQSMFSDALPSLSEPINSASSSIILPIASQIITGLIVSPLDLVRTRLIVQSSHPRYRTYSGPIDAFRQILTHEGGLKGIYLHPHLLIPTLLDSTARAVLPLMLPRLIASYFGVGGRIMSETNMLLWSIAQLLGAGAGLLIMVPFETIRKRLQVQVRGTAKPIRGCVELRPAPYNGVVDAFWHILTEERSDLPLKRRRRRRASTKGKDRRPSTTAADEPVLENGDSWLRNTGVGQLYRGLGLRLSATVFVFVLSIFSGDEADAGWAEL